MGSFLQIIFLTCFVAGCFSYAASNDEANTSGATLLPMKIGSALELSVATLLDDIVGCYLETPSGVTVEFKPEDKSEDRYELREETVFSKCSVSVKEMGVNDNGIWRLYTTDASDNVKEQAFNVVINGEDGDNNVNTMALDREVFDAKLEDTIIVSVPLAGYRDKDSCHITTPAGQEYSDTDSSEDSIKFLEDSNVACKVQITVSSEDLIGDWLMTVKESSMGAETVERILPFTVHVEETVFCLPSGQITIMEGNDFFIRLDKETDSHEDCTLVGPHEDDRKIERDELHIESCGFIVKSVTKEDEGEWEIVYGTRIVHRGSITLKVEASDRTSTSFLRVSLTRNQPVNMPLGPEEAIYCKLHDGLGVTAYEGRGPCQLVLDSVKRDHDGYWLMQVGLPGKLSTDFYHIVVTVNDEETNHVSTFTQHTDDAITMRCSVTSSQEVKTCVLRDPIGLMHVATMGVAEDRYSFSGAGSRLNVATGLYTNECGLRITNPTSSELGIWRCSLFTDDNTYHGFAAVPCESQNNALAIAAAETSETSSSFVWNYNSKRRRWNRRRGSTTGSSSSVSSRSENVNSCAYSHDLQPILKSDAAVIDSTVGDELVMTCQVPSSISYCYFRAQNGSIYSVNSNTKEGSYEYVGAGLTSGECGIKFHSISSRDAGRWSCHVGFSDLVTLEERAYLQVRVYDKMTVTQRMSQNTMIVEGQVYDVDNFVILDYCRFVRIDGTGFTTRSVPIGYTDISTLASGRCAIQISHPNILDEHPWTIVAKESGVTAEVQAQTVGAFRSLTMNSQSKSGGSVFLVFVLLPLTIFLLIISLMFATKKRRDWSVQRAIIIRDSFRRSFQKKEEVHPKAMEANNC